MDTVAVTKPAHTGPVGAAAAGAATSSRKAGSFNSNRRSSSSGGKRSAALDFHMRPVRTPPLLRLEVCLPFAAAGVKEKDKAENQVCVLCVCVFCVVVIRMRVSNHSICRCNPETPTVRPIVGGSDAH